MGLYEVDTPAGVELHLVLGELLEANGYADTPANRETLAAGARLVAGELWPGIPVTDA